MSDKLETSIKVRVASNQRRAVRRIAKACQLKEADIVRAALRFYLKAHDGKTTPAELEAA